MSEKRPGQAAFATYWERSAGRPLVMPDSWDMQPDGTRADWEAAANAANAPLRAAVAELAARVQASADATRPSAKTRAEDEVAAALRQILEES